MPELKGKMNPAQSEKDFQQQAVLDEDDGLLFFHTHSLWEAMSKLERFYECKIYGVLELEEVVENLRYYNAFDKESGEYYLCEVEEVGKQLWLGAMEYAYNNMDGNYDGYEHYMDCIYDYVVDAIKDARGI